ncbi:MAG: replication initiation protein [Bacteroidota bacterium]
MSESSHKELNRQPNHITMARMDFEVVEKRLMYYVLNNIETGINIQPELFNKNVTVKIPISLLGETNYGRIRQAAEKLQTRQIWLKDDPKQKKFDVITPFPRIAANRDHIELTVFSDILPYFLELKSGYTEYKLKAAIALTSKYSQRFYEFLSRWKDTGYWGPVTIEHLKELLFIEDKYSDIYLFKKKVLDIAKKELKKKTEISFEYRLIKEGRRFTKIEFDIYYSPENDEFQKVDEYIRDERSKRCKALLMEEFNILREDILKVILTEKQQEFWKWYHAYKTGKVKAKSNAGGLLLKTLGIY